ncbi:DNA polymerase II [Polyangium jinanense]|uniref:DNA polymerase n=1 Tax=Polyangium jinanense TaxID=2829994 RepID=A0A9X4AWL6_9BACT|nr:DNA polymerase II [Polyangium jinanense]MDC3962281.1 DNA polymerase II [Polyangium jinanense]MDC3985462.1 DNA polymerase II [Polyangium jinanense]
MNAERGFILTPTYRIHDDRTEVHLYAVLACGEPALLVHDQHRPYLFVRVEDATVARRVASERLSETPLVSFAGDPVLRIEAPNPERLAALRSSLVASGVIPLEADVRFVQRFLVDHGIRGAFSVEGPFERRRGVGRVYVNPHIEPASFVPRLSVLSFDIETSLDGAHLFSIAAAGQGGERVFLMQGGAATNLPASVDVFPDERSLLAAFFEHVQKADPDVLTGWSLPDFDLPQLVAFARRARLPCSLGRASGNPTIRRDPGFTREARAFVPGRVVLDGLALVRGAFVRLDDYRLETAARAILGRGKLFGPEGRADAIETAFRDDPAALAAYNLEDARLVLEIVQKLGLVELAVERSLLTGMPPDRVGSQIAAVDSLYLGELRGRGRVAPSVVRDDDLEATPLAGGLVLDGKPGFFRNVLVYDFKSLYPSIIRTFNIDPFTFAGEGKPGDASVVHVPGGATFRRDERGILPDLVARLGHERQEARRSGDERRAQAIKILMNSLYGVLGSPASRLFSPPVASAIPLAGQWVIRVAARAAGSLPGHRVLYGDTDSLFVDVGEPDPEKAAAYAHVLREHIAGEVDRAIGHAFSVESHLDLAFAKMYARFFLPEMRGRAEGSKKRYAGLVYRPSGDGEVEIVGLEAVRRDTSAIARRFQRELLDRVFHDRPVEPFVLAFVEDLRAGRFDAELVYRKALRKPLDAYTKTTPPHVKAARRLGGDAGRVVSYVVTKNGPEPTRARSSPLDHEHYVEHQIKPIADAVLRLSGGRDFDDVTGARRQLSLF